MNAVCWEGRLNISNTVARKHISTIGDGNTFREGVTLHRSFVPGEKTIHRQQQLPHGGRPRGPRLPGGQ